MEKLGLLFMFSLACAAASTNVILSRPKRYLVFPEGSTFSWAFCMTIKAITPDIDIFSEAVAVAVNYELPYNASFLEVDSKPRPVLARSERSAIYRKVENILDRLGVPGSACVLRALCEGAQELEPGSGVITEVLRIVLEFPEEGAEQYESKEQWRYLAARKSGLLNYNCPQLFPDCPISIIGIINTVRPIHA